MGINQKGQLNVTTLEKWSKKFDPQSPPFKSLNYRFLKINREGNAAQVKILFPESIKLAPTISPKYAAFFKFGFCGRLGKLCHNSGRRNRII